MCLQTNVFPELALETGVGNLCQILEDSGLKGFSASSCCYFTSVRTLEEFKFLFPSAFCCFFPSQRWQKIQVFLCASRLCAPTKIPACHGTCHSCHFPKVFSNSEQLSIFFLVLFLVYIAFYISPWLIVLVYICAVRSTNSSSLSSNMQLS